MKTAYLFILFLFVSPSLNSQDYYSISWDFGNSHYEGVLALNQNGTGMMRIQYYNPYANRYEAVDQVVYPTQSQDGYMVLAGYQPVYAGTNQLNLSYAADNLYLMQDIFGNIQWVNVDGFGNQAIVSIQQMNNHASQMYNYDYSNSRSQGQSLENFIEQMNRQNERVDFFIDAYKAKYGKSWADSFKKWH